MSHLPAMTMAEALGSIPEFVLDTMGEKTLKKCLSQAGLSVSLLDIQNGYVPEISIGKLLDTAAKISGEMYVGLHLVPIYSIHDYGMWGEYIVSAPDLKSAIERATSTIGIHASGDVLTMFRRNRKVHFKYIFEERISAGYENVAFAAAAALLSIPQHYLYPGWRPSYLGLDIKQPQSATAIEDTFGCPVLFDHSCIEVVFPEKYLYEKNPEILPSPKITLSDLTREYQGGPPTRYEDIIASMIRPHLNTEVIGLEQTAFALDIGPRSLQRRLSMEGTSYKDLVQSVRMKRAIELLDSSGQNLTEISSSLGYSSPSHFTRAFKNFTGIAPSKFARNSFNKVRRFGKD